MKFSQFVISESHCSVLLRNVCRAQYLYCRYRPQNYKTDENQYVRTQLRDTKQMKVDTPAFTLEIQN